MPLRPLEVEIARACDDDTVEGGTGAFIERWCAQTRALAPEELTSRLDRIREAFAGYPGLLSAEREELCRRTIKALLLYRATYAPDPNTDGVSPESPVQALKGIGSQRAQALAEMGIRTVEDLLRHYPMRYEDRRSTGRIAAFEHRHQATLLVTVTGAGVVKRPGSRVIAEVPASDAERSLRLVWFGQPYRAGQFQPGQAMLVTGTVMLYKGEYSLVVQEFELVPQEEAEGLGGEIGRVTPVYPSTAALAQPILRRFVQQALERCDPFPTGAVPERFVVSRELMPFDAALREVHWPTDDAQRRRARVRITYEELFLLQVALARKRAAFEDGPATEPLPCDGLVREFLEALPFEATSAQRRVITDLAADLESSRPASRLIHGDVGSGKTACAAFALLAAARQGRQGAMMAPTELLAEQHYNTLRELLAPFGYGIRLLVGALGGTAKKYAHRQIERGDDTIVVGTQALFQQAVTFRDLAVAIIDEQHRFGVRQRANLAAKGKTPNLFLMSATPIPRTLALTAYGDFDVSVLDEMPPGRRPVQTHVAWGKDRRAAYETAAAHLVRGRQAYVVCPHIEESSQDQVASAEKHYAQLSEGPFASFKVGLLHGKMDTDQKDEIMARFRRGEIEVLVSTTVIEVGVDVPNATVIMVENAERFGLAQLHQLRGRVGRGTEGGVCILMTRAGSPDVIERLMVLEKTTDGFEIAEEDLRRRGPGELTGARQSGLPDLKMADLAADTQTLVIARDDAFALVADDPHLEQDEHAALRRAVERFEAQSAGWAL